MRYLKLLGLAFILLFIAGCSSVSVNHFSGITEDVIHERTRQGDVYRITQFEDAISNNQNITFMLRTDSREVHLLEYLVTASDNPTDVILYEGGTTTSNGTELTPLNNNRNSAKTSATKVYYEPNVSDFGLELERNLITANKDTGGLSGNSVTHLILKNNTMYFITAINRAGANEELDFNILYYEE